jgi:REP element-mobilizing transposase RayT
MESLASVFGCDVLSYAILSNHMHLILRNRPDVVASWSDEQVAVRWLRVFPGRRLEEHLGEPTQTDVETLVRDAEKLAVVRRRLSDISWFMRALSEPIARMANRQDECTGRFWEGRFKAQRITDEAGLLACAMYVDLNPVRAALAPSPEESLHTSGYDRIHGQRGKEMNSAAYDLVAVDTEQAGKTLRSTTVDELKKQKAAKRKRTSGKRIRRDAWLSPLSLGNAATADKPQASSSGVRASDKGFLKMSVTDYTRLLCWTAKQSQPSEAHPVPKSLQSVVSRLGIDLKMWRDLVWNYKRYFGNSSCAGSPESMSQHARSQGHKWAKGQRSIHACFSA